MEMNLPFVLPRSIKLVPGNPVNLMVNPLQPSVACLNPLIFSEGIDKQHWAVMG